MTKDPHRLWTHGSKASAITGHFDPVRTLVRTLAIRGVLTAAEPGDQDVDEYIEGVRSERERLFRDLGIRRPKKVTSLQHPPLGVPEHWTWVQLDDLTDPRAPTCYGVLVPGPNVEGGVPFVRVQDLAVNGAAPSPSKAIAPAVDRKFERSRLRGGELLLTVVGSIGKLGVAPADWAGANIARAVARITPISMVERDYLLLVLSSQTVQEYFKETTRTLAQPTLNIGLVRAAPIPVPPPEEQRRIVTTVLEVERLVDRVDAERSRLETARRQARASCLRALVENGEWDRVRDNWDSLITAPESVDDLRRAILDLAVRGRLVEQCSDDGSGADLLAGLRGYREARIEKGELKRPRHPIGVPVDSVPFEIPESWSWVRLGDVGAIIGGGTPKSSEPAYWADREAVPWLTPADMSAQPSRYIQRGERDITEEGLSASSAQLLPKGTVLFSSRAPIGHLGIAANPIATNQGFKSCVPDEPGMAEYIYYYLKQSTPAIAEAASGTTFKEVSGKEVSLVPIAVPPLNEQHRIVAKVDSLLGLCDELEEAVRGAQAISEALAESVVHHAGTE